jgi:hypothetical protein
VSSVVGSNRDLVPSKKREIRESTRKEGHQGGREEGKKEGAEGWWLGEREMNEGGRT